MALVLALLTAAVVAAGCVAQAQPTVAASEDASSVAVSWDSARSHVGESTRVQGQVVSTHYAASSNGSPTFLNIGLDYPDPGRFQVVIFGDARSAFSGAPEDMYRGKTVEVSGVIELYEGVTEMIVDSPGDITALQ